MIFPWQGSQWEQLCRADAKKHLPHALLFTGLAGLGKRSFAETFAGYLLCKQVGAQGATCGLCHDCQLFQAKTHPDFRVIEPEEAGQVIKIDQIRECAEFVQQSAHQGGRRVLLIEPATAMNKAAANALLKTLEEPLAHTVIILITARPSDLLLTIRSRCHLLRFEAPDKMLALAWLKAQDASLGWEPLLEATQGAPLLARAWQKEGVWPQYESFMRDLRALTAQEADPLALALQWKEANMLWLFDLFFHWLLKLLRLQQDPARSQDEPFVSGALSTEALFQFVDYMQMLRADYRGSPNLNQQLLLESLFIRWSYYVSR